MTEKYAYQASPELASALRTVEADIDRFIREVRAPWEAQHPQTKSLWRRGLVDLKCIGFTDPGGDVPVGLSRSKSRVELVPARGRHGDQWRAARDLLNSGPSISEVFGRFGIDPTILKVDHGRLYLPGIVVTDDAVFVTWDVPREEPSPHLIPVPLSVYYQAVEQHDAQTVAEAG